MIKKTVSYTSPFDGEEITEDLYFHYSKAELIEMEMSTGEGLSETLRRITSLKENDVMFREFKKIIVGAYGVKNGRLFIKNDEVREEFLSSEAYSVLIMSLVTDTEAMVEFINGIVPKDLGDDPKVTPLSVVANPRIVTRAEMLEMSQDDFRQLGIEMSLGNVVIEDDTLPSDENPVLEPAE